MRSTTNIAGVRKISVLLLAFLLIITSCSREDSKEEASEEAVTEKTDFFIETTLWSEFSGESFLKKIWQVSSSQDIDLSANANGRVASVTVKTGDNVSAGQVIARLEDNIGSYGINLQRANNSIERAKINYDSQKISLDKQVYDAQKNLETLERNLLSLRRDNEQTLMQARDNLDNSKFDGADAKLALQIEKLENNIEKAIFDYEITLESNRQTIEDFKSNLLREYDSLILVMDDSLDFSDEILGITPINKTKNDRYEMFLWVKDREQLFVTENTFRELKRLRESTTLSDIQINAQSWDFSQEYLLSVLTTILSSYDLVQELLINLELTLNNSTQSVWSLGETEINAFIWSINGYQSQVQGNRSALINFRNSVRSFLSTYEDSEASILKSIELQERDIAILKKDREIQSRNLDSWEVNAETSLEKTLINIEKSVEDLESQIDIARNNIDNAIKTRAVTLKSLQNAIIEARIWYSSSAKELGKLTISSPINGTISDVFIDRGQEVFSGTQLVSIVSDKTPEIEISFSSEEQALVRDGQKVYVEVGNEKISWTIYAISDVADENLNYKATVVFKSGTNLIWNLVSVDVPIETNKMLVPINILTTQGWEIATVKTLSGSTFSDVRMRMWEVFWEYVEIVSCAKECRNLNIITSDVSNFDENKFTIVEK